MPINYPLQPNSVRVAINQNYRRRLGGSSVVMAAQAEGIAIVYGETIVEGQLIAIVDGKAVKPSVVYADDKPAIGIALSGGDADSLGSYMQYGEYATAEAISTGILYLSATSPYYSLTMPEANGNTCQILGRQVTLTKMILDIDQPEKIEV